MTWRIPGVWLVVLAGVVVWGSSRAAQGQSGGNDASSRPRAAFLNLDHSPLGTLLEQQLLAHARAIWLERTEIDAILRERQLDTLLGAAASEERTKIGKLLKADLLVLLAGQTQPESQNKGLHLVVCETAFGLRLATMAVAAGDKPESDVALLERVVDRAIKRHHEKIAEIVAIPPFASQDLSYERNHMQGAYAKLVEQALADRPGLVMVELAEARAIAEELAAAGGEATVRRPSPIYLLGEFRHEGQGDQLRVTVRLKAFRGKDRLSAREARLRPDEAPAFLQKSAGELVLAGAEASAKRPDSHQEAQRLTERAVEFQQLGQWEESLALLEAALLLEPSQERHRRAVGACSRLTLAYGYYTSATLENKMRGRQYYLRGLEHIEEFFRSGGNISGNNEGTYDAIYRYPFVEFGLYLKDPSQPDAAAAVAKEREILLRIVRQRVRGGYGDEQWAMIALDRDHNRKDYFELLYQFLVDFQGLPSFPRFAEFYTRFDPWRYHCPEADEFIAKLEQSGNEELRERGKALRAKKQQQAEKPAPWGARRVDPFLSKVPDSQAARFTLFRFSLLDGPNAGRKLPAIRGCTDAGPRMEIVWTVRHLLAIESPSGLKELWGADGDVEITGVVYDGRYAWATVERSRQRPWLLAIDPENCRIRQITEADGLPLQAEENVPRSARQHLMVAPVSPGRVCVAGSFGRSWVALVTFDPHAARPVGVDVIHEARRTWDGSKGFVADPGAAFDPFCMSLLTDKPAAGGDVRRQVLIARIVGGGAVYPHPLLIDPQTRSVSVLSPEMEFRWRGGIAHQGAVYFDSLKTPELIKQIYRVRLPDLKPTLFAADVPSGSMIFGDDGLHIVGRKWWRLRADGRLDDMGFVPWHYEERDGGAGRRWAKADSDDVRVVRPEPEVICRSRYYGFLVSTTLHMADPNQQYTTYQVSFQEEKAVPAAPIIDKSSRHD